LSNRQYGFERRFGYPSLFLYFHFIREVRDEKHSDPNGRGALFGGAGRAVSAGTGCMGRRRRGCGVGPDGGVYPDRLIAGGVLPPEGTPVADSPGRAGCADGAHQPAVCAGTDDGLSAAPGVLFPGRMEGEKLFLVFRRCVCADDRRHDLPSAGGVSGT